MTITTNTTLIRIFLNQDTEVKKLKKKRYLIKVTLDNGMVIQLNDVPFEINNEFIDFKLNNSNQMIAKQLVDTANAVLIKMPSSVSIKTETKETIEFNTNKEENTMENNELFNKVKEIIGKNEDFMSRLKLENADIDVAVASLILPLNVALEHISDKKIRENMVNAFITSLEKNNEDKNLTKELSETLKTMATFEEKLAKIPEAMEINRQGVKQLKASCEKLSQEAEEVIFGKQSQKQDVEAIEENKLFNGEEKESILYTVAKTAGKVVGVAALGVVGYLSYNFIKSKLTS